MSPTRLALGASLTTTTCWTAKAVAIGVAGGLDESPLEGPLFMLGLVSCLIAAGAVGVAVGRARSLALKILSALGGVAAVLLLTIATGVVVSAAQPATPGWAWGEVNLWLVMLVLVAVSLGWQRRLATTEPATAATRSSMVG